MNAVIQAQAWLGYFDARRTVGVENTANYWYFAVVVWLVTFATLYLSPHVF